MRSRRKNENSGWICIGIGGQISSVFFYLYQSPGLPETLATAYNPGMCLLALPVIFIGPQKRRCERNRSPFCDRVNKKRL